MFQYPILRDRESPRRFDRFWHDRPGIICCCTPGGGVRVFGGQHPTTFLSAHSAYSEGGNSWSSKAAIPKAKYEAASSTIGTTGYLFCGQTDASTNAFTTDAYSYVDDSWTTLTSVPTPKRSGSSGAAFGSAAYTFNGETATTPTFTQQVDQYASGSWTTKTAGPTPGRTQGCSPTIGTAAYCIGGSNGSASIANNDKYVVDSWSVKTAIPVATQTQAASTIGSTIYIGAGTTFTDVQTWRSYVDDTWTTKTSTPTPARHDVTRGNLATAASSYLICGTTNLTQNDQYTPDTWANKLSWPNTGMSGGSGFAF